MFMLKGRDLGGCPHHGVEKDVWLDMVGNPCISD